MKNGELYVGLMKASKITDILDEIKEKTGAHVSVYFADERVATSQVDKNGERAVGTRVSNDVVVGVLGKGLEYEATENILGDEYAVKYVPIKDKDGKVIGMWSSAVSKTSIGKQRLQIIAMRASIVVISILCGIIGCIISMLYIKKFLSDIDTLKVSFLEANKSNNKTQQRVISLTLVLIFTFFLIWFIIQGYTVGNVVTSLANNNIKENLNISSNLGYMLIDELYKGDWTTQEGKMYKGTVCLNDNLLILNRVSIGEDYFSSFYLGDLSIATNTKAYDSTKTIGNKVPNVVVENVLKQGQEYVGEINFTDKKCIAKYMPLKDDRGKIIGMWSIGVEKKVVAKQIANLRKNITQVSLLAIIIAFSTFLYISIRMTSNINNYKVRLHTNIN